ncbi:Oxysterol-binding protein-related protein 9 [Pteropus alecto]|uniref:Oxysterol-binding protein-related protein 9 n=1 Tax=Pteropus alecto TaxID=9402 RepID=L5KM62_PTEAL|nr:Oxysterol-binding protein-related protein 9 [Pteropus alecto]
MVPSQPVLPPEPAQPCKPEPRLSSLLTGPLLATWEHHQVPAANSAGSGHYPPSSTLTSPSHVKLSVDTATVSLLEAVTNAMVLMDFIKVAQPPNA